MGRTLKNYANTNIYKISQKDCDNNFIYVGHTTHFIERKADHKYSTNNTNATKYNLSLYKYIRENGGWENWEMILVEKYPCESLREAEMREEYWRLFFNAKLNKKKCYLSDEFLLNYSKNYYKENILKNKQYYQDNKEKIIEKHKIYYENNKVNILTKKRERYHNKKCIDLYKNDLIPL
jgi:hypothetical protein